MPKYGSKRPHYHEDPAFWHAGQKAQDKGDTRNGLFMCSFSPYSRSSAAQTYHRTGFCAGTAKDGRQYRPLVSVHLSRVRRWGSDFDHHVLPTLGPRGSVFTTPPAPSRSLNSDRPNPGDQQGPEGQVTVTLMSFKSSITGYALFVEWES